MDDMEQYSRRTCLKFSGIQEKKGENTDKLVLKVINELVLPVTGQSLSLDKIGRTHRVGNFSSDPKKPQRPRDIIVRFISYRDRALVYSNKRNLKTHNDNPETKSKLYINEALTVPRANLFRKTRELLKSKIIASCWTIDGKILVKTHQEKTVHIKVESDLEQFLKMKLKPTDVSFVHHTDKAITSTPLPSGNQKL